MRYALGSWLTAPFSHTPGPFWEGKYSNTIFNILTIDNLYRITGLNFRLRIVTFRLNSFRSIVCFINCLCARSVSFTDCATYLLRFYSINCDWKKKTRNSHLLHSRNLIPFYGIERMLIYIDIYTRARVVQTCEVRSDRARARNLIRSNGEYLTKL